MAIDQACESLLVAGPQASQQFAFVGTVRRAISAQSLQARRDRLPRWVAVRVPALHGENVGNVTASRRTL
jgi:hypothetical protein